MQVTLMKWESVFWNAECEKDFVIDSWFWACNGRKNVIPGCISREISSKCKEIVSSLEMTTWVLIHKHTGCWSMVITSLQPVSASHISVPVLQKGSGGNELSLKNPCCHFEVWHTEYTRATSIKVPHPGAQVKTLIFSTQIVRSKEYTI